MIIDNLHEFKISLQCETNVDERRNKSFSHLIAEVDELIPGIGIKESMEKVRDYGNQYIHPGRTKVSKEAMFQSKENARDCLFHLRDTVAVLYGFK